MKKLLLLLTVSMLATTSVFAEGESMANAEGADCGDRIEQVLDGQGSGGTNAGSDASVRFEG